ncbi:MAG: FHA domain-containing protein [Candidatus Flexifilum sp.]|jgi:predicted component of type VI protein secretion system
MDDTSARSISTRTRLVLHVGAIDAPQVLSVPLQSRMVVGRGSVEDGIDIDLTRFQAAELGVSRQHCILSFKDDVLSVQDAYSTNGTRINGKRLDPQVTYRLRQGDELELGRLRLTVRLLRS